VIQKLAAIFFQHEMERDRRRPLTTVEERTLAEV
jgi:hypothetical protein